MREIIADSRMMHIGKNGEGDALRVTFPVVAEWEALYGAGGVWTLNVQRNGDALAYAAQDFTIKDGAALWVVTDADAAVVGEGRCELTYKIGDTVAKSRTYAFRVDRSLTGGGDVPDPVKGWQEALEERVDGKLDRPDGGSAGDVLTKTGDGEEWKKPTGENVVYIAKTGTDTYAVKRNASDENPMPFAELLAMAKAPSTTVAVFDRYRLPLAALTDTGMMFESVYSATVFTVLVMQDNSAYQQSVTVMNAPLTDALEIPEWALSENKPTYTASEVGAVASQQAVSDAGKVLTVGDDGKVVPGNISLPPPTPPYTLPTASPTVLGGVKPIAKTDAMTQGVGVDDAGALWTAAGSGGTDISLGLTSAQVGQIVKVKAVDENGKPTLWEALNRDWEVKATYALKDMTFPAAISIPPESDSMLFISGTDITINTETKVKITLKAASQENGYSGKWEFSQNMYKHGWGCGMFMELNLLDKATKKFWMQRAGWAPYMHYFTATTDIPLGETNRNFYYINVDNADNINPETTTNVILYMRDAL